MCGHKILGIPENATMDDVKRAYRKLALQYHPDINKTEEAAKKMKLINKAYGVLTGKIKSDVVKPAPQPEVRYYTYTVRYGWYSTGTGSSSTF